MKPAAINNLRPVYSMLEIFVTSGEVTELREHYLKSVAIPAMKAENPNWKPKTINEAYEILKKHFKKQKATTPNFINKESSSD